MATYNGDIYLKEQLTSILSQLSNQDELIVSDDGSNDCSLKIIYSFNDNRIKVFQHKKSKQRYNIDYVTHNYEFALKQCSGQYIFLADQDDVWLPGKVNRMLAELNLVDMVLSNCSVADSSLNIIYPSYFEVVQSQKGIIHNIIKNSYLGCCMAFKRKILNKVLPFPPTGVGHDLWIGLISSLYYKVSLIKEPLILYRKHDNNVTPSAMKSTNPISFKIYYRLLIIKALFKRIIFKS